jgi:hypothetical protein
LTLGTKKEEEGVIEVHQEEKEAEKLFGEDRHLQERIAREEAELLQIDQ